MTRMIAAYEPRGQRSRETGVREELEKLAAARGAGEHLAVHGDVWGGAYVVVAYPRIDPRRLVVVEFDSTAYPALASACEVRTPQDDED